MPQTEIDINHEFDVFYEEYMKYHPFKATWRGDFSNNDSLENSVSEQYLNKYKNFLSQQLYKFENVNHEQIPSNSKTSLTVLKWQLKNEIEGLKFGLYWGSYDKLRPFNHFECRAVEIAHFGQGLGFPFRNQKDYLDFIERMKDFDVWVDSAISNMNKGIAIGDVSPKFTIEKYLPTLKSYTSKNPDVNSFYYPLFHIPKDVSNDEKETITTFYKIAIEEQFIPTFQKIVTYLKNDYLPKCRETDGMIHLPNGEAEYRHLVRYFTTTKMPAEEIFELGLSEVERIKSEMLRVKNEIGIKNRLSEFMKQLDQDPNNFPFKQEEDILVAYQGILDTVNNYLPSLFDVYPKTPFEIRVDNAAGNEERIQYIAGSLKDSLPGIFSFAVPNPSKFRALDMENIFLHEGIPGHHFQICFANEIENIPEFQKKQNLRAFTEGWALYTEGLGSELGLYTDQYQYLGRLMAEMMRAARLVIDVGIHLKGWSRKEALEFYSKECLLGDGTSEVDRMTVYPAQALSYKVGELAILNMKNKAQKTLGANFNIKDFHYQLLKNGSLPIENLRRNIDLWIDNQIN